MRKIFIDAGGHKGQSIEAFKQESFYEPSFEIYCFEPNPYFKKYLVNREDILFLDYALWIYYGWVEFFINSKKLTATGSTLIGSKNNVDKEAAFKVKCIDFSHWLVRTFKKDDYIILRMDIEGAEYEVLQKMLKDKTIHYINDLSVEFHYTKTGYSKLKHDFLIQQLKDIKNVKFKIEGVYQ